MLEIKDIKVYNLSEAIVKSGFPMDTGNLIEQFGYHVACVNHYIGEKTGGDNLISLFNKEEMYKIGESHFNRAKKLANTPSGSGHDCFTKSVRVSFNLKYPEYISPQLQRYNWFDIESSQSKMHRLTEMDIKTSCNKYVDDEMIDNLNKWIYLYNNFEGESSYSKIEKTILVGIHQHKYTKYEIFMKIISNCPMGFEKWMGVSTNYMQLKTMYKQRKSHKLKEDYCKFCEFVENLPLFKELMLDA